MSLWQKPCEIMAKATIHLQNDYFGLLDDKFFVIRLFGNPSLLGKLILADIFLETNA